MGSKKLFLGGWIPDRAPSTIALVWQISTDGRTQFMAEITKAGQKTGVREAATLPELVDWLTRNCGPARRSMVRLCGKLAPSPYSPKRRGRRKS